MKEVRKTWIDEEGKRKKEVRKTWLGTDVSGLRKTRIKKEYSREWSTGGFAVEHTLCARIVTRDKKAGKMDATDS